MNPNRCSQGNELRTEDEQSSLIRSACGIIDLRLSEIYCAISAININIGLPDVNLAGDKELAA
jgi:hypothetical protein